MITRHNLLNVDVDGREYAYQAITRQETYIRGDLVSELVRDLRIPAIVKRQEHTDEGFLDVGFSSYKRIDGNRFRIASEIPIGSVTGIVNPFDVMDKAENLSGAENTPLKRKLSVLVSAGNLTNIRVGLFGSIALHIITGYPYLNEQSDIDIIIKASAASDIGKFVNLLDGDDILKNSNLDIELDISDGYAVKLKELLSNQKTVLAKGVKDAKIIDRLSVLQKFL